MNEFGLYHGISVVLGRACQEFSVFPADARVSLRRWHRSLKLLPGFRSINREDNSSPRKRRATSPFIRFLRFSVMEHGMVIEHGKIRSFG
jgi:hypothetical protein